MDSDALFGTHNLPRSDGEGIEGGGMESRLLRSISIHREVRLQPLRAG